MQAWKCDRCGKLYATIRARENCRLKDVTVIDIGWSDPDVFKGQRADLCEECAKEFIEWFREPTLAAITREGDDDEPDQTV